MKSVQDVHMCTKLVGPMGFNDLMVHSLPNMRKLNHVLSDVDSWLFKVSNHFGNWRLLQKRCHAFNACVRCPIHKLNTLKIGIIAFNVSVSFPSLIRYEGLLVLYICSSMLHFCFSWIGFLFVASHRLVVQL